MEKEILKQLELQRKTIAEEHREYINEKVDRILEDMKIRKGLITGRKLIGYSDFRVESTSLK